MLPKEGMKTCDKLAKWTYIGSQRLNFLMLMVTVRPRLCLDGCSTRTLSRCVQHFILDLTKQNKKIE